VTDYEAVLGVTANWAAILTALIALLAYGRYECARNRKRRCLEEYLKAEKAKATNKGQRTILHLVARLSMTEGDVLDAAFRSKRVRCVTNSDHEGYVAQLLFEYVGD
jgi:hypothetical protein